MGPHEERRGTGSKGVDKRSKKKQQQKRTIAGDQELLVGMQVVATLTGLTPFPKFAKAESFVNELNKRSLLFRQDK